MGDPLVLQRLFGPEYLFADVAFSDHHSFLPLISCTTIHVICSGLNER
jgi:hypothetical protein